MNFTSTRFASHARTWRLIAGLTALLVGTGALIGGGFLYLFAGLAVVLNVIGYWFSDRIAHKFSRARPVEPGTMPELEAMVQDLAQRAQVPVPRLYTIPSEQPNAFATGRNPRHVGARPRSGARQRPGPPPRRMTSTAASAAGIPWRSPRVRVHQGEQTREEERSRAGRPGPAAGVMATAEH